MTKVVKASSITDAIKLTKKLNGRFLAGGTDIVLAIKKKILKLDYLIDITDITELHGIKKLDSYIYIGATTTISELENELIKKYAPTLYSCIKYFATPSIRNMATLAGNLANASPAADAVVGLIADGAIAVIHNGTKKYELPVEDIPSGVKKTILKNYELIVGFKIPIEKKIGIFMKIAPRDNTGIAKCAVGISCNKKYRIAINAVAPKVIRAKVVENILNDGGSVDEAAKRLVEEINPITDSRSTKEYRIHIAKVLFKRSIMYLWKQKK